MAHHDLTTPITEAQTRALRIDDTVSLNGPLFGIRDATQIHMFDRGRKTRFDLKGQAVLFHTGHRSDQLAVELARRGIPFIKYGGLKSLEAAHVKDVLCV